MKTRDIIILLLIGAVAWACKLEEIPVFDSDVEGIYFQRVSRTTQSSTGAILSYTYTDSTALSFSGFQGTSSIQSIPIRTMGKLKDYDRPVKVEIDPERTTATRGVHFDVDLDTVAVKANTSTVNLRVKLIRTPDMTENTYCIAFKLLDNEHFKCLLPMYKSNSSYGSTDKLIPGDKYIISVSEQYTMPWYWLFFGDDYFGPWTPLKYMLINSVCGWTPEDWDNGGNQGTPVQAGRLDFAARAVQKHLQKMADEGTPVLDNDGSYMTLNDNYPIDYSKYE